MALDLLSTIRHEIDERLSELRPLLAEHERLLGAVEALEAAAANDASSAPERVDAPERVATPRSLSPERSDSAKPASRRGRLNGARRGTAAGAIKRAAAASEPAATEKQDKLERREEEELAVLEPAGNAKPERATRGLAPETILAALGHGSHTVAELAIVTAMSGPSINASLRKLVAAGTVIKIEREGKAAWALPEALA